MRFGPAGSSKNDGRCTVPKPSLKNALLSLAAFAFLGAVFYVCVRITP
jgi:hypothetical protein